MLVKMKLDLVVSFGMCNNKTKHHKETKVHTLICLSAASYPNTLEKK